MYAKLIDGVMHPAPAALQEGGRVIYNPSVERLTAAGYMPVIETPYPETDEESTVLYVSSWEQRDGSIVQVWVEYEPGELEEETAPSIEDRVGALENAVFFDESATKADYTAALQRLGVDV